MRDLQRQWQFPPQRHYKVKVPKGIKEGALLRIQGHGEKGLGSGKPGDLYLKVHYSRHPDFRVENGTLHHELEIAPGKLFSAAWS
jgi:curved DNA-binding protein